jgi:signal transduction histidine kinase
MTDVTTASITAESHFAAAVEAAKLQAIYNLAYGLSHEINNPLANIATRAQTLLLDEKDPERRRKLATINQQAFRAHEMIADLMLFARPPAMNLARADLAALADAVVAELQPLAQEQDATLVRTGSREPLIATVDATQIAVALRALVQNSLEAVRSGGRVEVEISDFRCQISDCEGGQFEVQGSRFKVENAHAMPPAPNLKSEIRNLKLTVSDTGPGIPSEVRPQIFDPFFSGREAGRGLGLGLSKAWRIVESHGGTLSVVSPATGGATFTIALPNAG